MSVKWLVGEPDQSCVEVCASAPGSSVCELNVLTTFASGNSSVPIPEWTNTCTGFGDGNSGQHPSLRVSDSKCYTNGEGDGARATCESKDPDSRRFCPCSPISCSITPAKTKLKHVNVDGYTTSKAQQEYMVWEGAVLSGADYKGHVHSKFIIMKGGTLYCGENFTQDGVSAGLNYNQGIGSFAHVYVQDGGSVDLESCFRATPHGPAYSLKLYYENPADVLWLKNEIGERDKEYSVAKMTSSNGASVHCSNPILIEGYTTSTADEDDWWADDDGSNDDGANNVKGANLNRCKRGCWNGGTPNSNCTACEQCDSGYRVASDCKEMMTTTAATSGNTGGGGKNFVGSTSNSNTQGSSNDNSSHVPDSVTPTP